MRKSLSLDLFAILFLCHFAYAEKVAIIGGGAAGLVSAWLLEQHHDVTLYEAENHLGGHADTVEIKIDDTTVAIEAGAEFFNEPFYPHFLKLLRYFNIPLNTYTLVSTFYNVNGKDIIILPPYHDGKVEWKSFTPNNLFKSIQFKIVIDKSRQFLSTQDNYTTLQSFVDTLNITNEFKNTLFYPTLAAAWGVSPNDIKDFSAFTSLKYLIEGYDAPKYQWIEVKDGLKKYIETVRESLEKTEIKLNARVIHIEKTNGKYTVITENGLSGEYDHLVFATPANVTAALLSTLPDTRHLSTILNEVKYYDTKIAIHSDERFMPPKKEDWRVVNIRYDGTHAATTMYKAWKSKTPIFKSWLTYDVLPDQSNRLPSPLYALLSYKHPVTDYHYFQAQEAIAEAQGKDNLWFAGMWTYDNDSHESAIVSAIKVAERLAPHSERLKIIGG